MSKEKSDSDKKIVLWGIGAAVIIIALWLSTYFLLVNLKPVDRGTLGDMFGTVNALFSGLALAGIIFTILLQRKELGYQRDELRATRKEFKIQNETLKQQRFENTLFQMIGIHHEVIDKLSFDKGFRSETLEKRAVLANAVNDLKTELRLTLPTKETKNMEGQDVKRRYIPEDSTEVHKLLIKGYEKFYFKRYKQLLSHYFRHIYHVFKFIYTSDLIEQHQRTFYASIARAQLSSDELFLILYNSLTPNLGYPKFLFLIKELDIMQNFDFNLVDEFKVHEDIYEALKAEVQSKFNVPNNN